MCGMGLRGIFSLVNTKIPDILYIAKGLGAGYQPIGAMICSKKFIRYRKGKWIFQHGHTYLGHPMAAAAANAVLDVLVEQNLLSDVTPKGVSSKRTFVEIWSTSCW